MVKNERRSQRRTRQHNTTIPCRIQRNRPKPRRIHVLYIGTQQRLGINFNKQCKLGKGPNIENWFGPCKLGGPFIEVFEKKTYKQWEGQGTQQRNWESNFNKQYNWARAPTLKNWFPLRTMQGL